MLPDGLVDRRKQRRHRAAAGEVKKKMQKCSQDRGKKKTAKLPAGNRLFHTACLHIGYAVVYSKLQVAYSG